MTETRKPAKLIFLHPYFHNGGAEKSILRLAQVALERGYACDIVTIRPSAVFADEIARIGVGFVDLGAARLLAALPAWLRYLRAQEAAGFRLLVVANQSYVNIFAVLFRWLYPPRTRLVLSERHHFSDYRLSGSRLKATLIPLLMRLTYRFADAVTANSTGLARDVQNLTGTPCACLFNPTLDGRILALAKQPVEHRWFDGQHRVIVAAGRLEKVKGFALLIEAFAALREEFPLARLLILGEGGLRADLQAQIDACGLQESAELAGFQANPYPFMAQAELFVLSSYNEGLPNTLIEAVICGTPALSTDCPSGPEDILLGGLGGDLVPVGDAQALAGAMRRYLADPARARSLHAVAREGCARFEQQAAGLAFLQTVDPQLEG